MKLGDQTLNVNLTGVSNADDLVANLQSTIDSALANYDTAQGLTGDYYMEEKISVSLNKDRTIGFTNNTGKTLSFKDKERPEFAKNLAFLMKEKP